MLTSWKKTAELAFLGEVSCVPLQQALRHLQAAFARLVRRRQEIFHSGAIRLSPMCLSGMTGSSR